MSGTTSQVGSSSDATLLDPTGSYANLLSQLTSSLSSQSTTGNAYDSTSYMNSFLNQADSLSDLVSGSTSNLQKSLNATAEKESKAAGESALASMPGAASSGAGMAAYGTATATPFANVANSIESKQLDTTSDLWSQAMGLDASSTSTLQSLLGSSANAGTSWYTPTYSTSDSATTTLKDLLSSGTSIASILTTLGLV